MHAYHTSFIIYINRYTAQWAKIWKKCHLEMNKGAKQDSGSAVHFSGRGRDFQDM